MHHHTGQKVNPFLNSQERRLRKMQQEKGWSEGIMKQDQDRSLSPIQEETQQQPQKCPRCDSLNTKFCYYNNYSLSQPRYFCKTCRRYWTQGGTLRNVPVGGGCRKGKRAKTSSTSSSSEDSRTQLQPHPQSSASSQNIISTTKSNSGNTVSLALRTKLSSADMVLHPGTSSMGPYCSGGGLLTSLAAIQSLHNQPPQSFALNQPVNLGGELGSSSSSSSPLNLSLFHGFNAFGSQQIQRKRQIYHTSNRENNSGNHPFYASSSQQPNWYQGFVSTTTNPTVSNTTLWSTGNTNSNSTGTAGFFSLNPHNRDGHDLPGYGPPP